MLPKLDSFIRFNSDFDNLIALSANMGASLFIQNETEGLLQHSFSCFFPAFYNCLSMSEPKLNHSLVYSVFLEARASHGLGLSLTRSVRLGVCHTLADLCSV